MEKISIVYQTHWDREWYYNVDLYNIRLKKVITRVIELLDNNDIEYFVLDGQVKALEDYFSICEDYEKEAITKHLKSKRLIIGPWYVLSDEFLVSGESLIRNLETGIKKSKEFCDYQKVGYLPDTFGHNSQMPQILKKFGLNSSIIWRGVEPDDTFFNWESPNGDSVFVVYLKEGYYQPIVDQENYEVLMNTFITKYSAFSNYSNILLTNGGDHIMPAYADIKANIKHLEDKYKIQIESTSYSLYVDSIENKKSYQTIKGELRSNKNCYVLPNVLSTRYYIKQKNQQLEERFKMLESLIVKAHTFSQYNYQKTLDQAWETFLLNHPHDSICGCSIDDVHKEMDTRTLKINHTLDALEKDCYQTLGAFPDIKNNVTNATKIFDDYTKFSIHNPSLRYINNFRKVKIFVNKESSLVDNFVISDGLIDYTTTIISKNEKRIFESPLDYFPEFRTGYEYEVFFRVKDLKGNAFKNYTLKNGQPLLLSRNYDKHIENKLVSITLEDDGTLTIFDKNSLKTHKKQNNFFSSLDNGDEYNYSKPENDQISSVELTDFYVNTSTYYQELHYTLELQVPRSLNFERTSGTEESVKNKLDIVVSITDDSKAIDVKVTYQNQAKNQRTRVSFAQSETLTKHYSDTPFDIVERHIRNEEFKADKSKEVPVVVDPSSSLIVLDNGFRLDHFGLNEYQVNQNCLAVTLMRSVGDLSRDDFQSRGGGAGPSFKTPDAQMIGTYHYHYQILCGQKKNFEHNDTFRLQLNTTKGHVIDEKSILQISNNNIYVSSLRKRDNYLELRLFNPTTENQNLNIKSAYIIKSIEATNLLGELIKESTKEIKAKEIKTLKVVLENPKVLNCDVFVCGGSIGGVRAAVKLLEKGKRVILSEATKWIGGQLTNQAVPLDEHPFIESFGAPKSYMDFRKNVRKYYQSNYDVIDSEKSNEKFNPGNAWVTRLAFEPKVAHHFFMEMISPYIGKNLVLLINYKPIKSTKIDNQIHSVWLENTKTNEQVTVSASHYIDATDLGDLLPITQTEYVTGRESVKETNEPHATVLSDKEDMQPVTHVVAMQWNPNNNNQISKPKYYEYFKSIKTPYADLSILSEYGPDSSTGNARHFNTYKGSMQLWSYRRFFDPSRFINANKLEMTTINWPQNDYFMNNVFDHEFDDQDLHMAKELTKSFVYYLQNEVPRHDKGFGYPEMEICKDALGTDDGFAMAPYIREGRRIKALKTVFEQDVLSSANKTLPRVEHSVGVGCYHIDLHITTRTHQFFYDNTWPFEIPLGAFIPVSTSNLIPGCKNIGTTHLTNGCFRLHPVEWNIGEVSGLLTAYLMDNNLTAKELYKNQNDINKFQKILLDEGIQLHWDEKRVHVI